MCGHTEDDRSIREVRCPPARGQYSAMTRHVILFLAANPHTTNPLRLGEECAAIQRELKMAPQRDDFQFESRWAVSIDELIRHLNELSPTVIHFSGHGGGGADMFFGEESPPQPAQRDAAVHHELPHQI